MDEPNVRAEKTIMDRFFRSILEQRMAKNLKSEIYHYIIMNMATYRRISNSPLYDQYDWILDIPIEINNDFDFMEVEVE